MSCGDGRLFVDFISRRARGLAVKLSGPRCYDAVLIGQRVIFVAKQTGFFLAAMRGPMLTMALSLECLV